MERGLQMVLREIERGWKKGQKRACWLGKVIEGELERELEKGFRRKPGKGNRIGLELGGSD